MDGDIKLLNKIKDGYSKEKKQSDKIVSLWLFYVLRPLSFLLTSIFLWLNVSANFATLIGFIVGFLSLIASSAGFLLIGPLLYNLFHILDCVDGNIARVREPSKKGEYYDAVSGDFINYFFIPSLAYGIQFEKGLLFDNAFLNQHFFHISLMSSIFFILTTLASQRKKIIFGNKGILRLNNKKKISPYEYVFRNMFGVYTNAIFAIFLTLTGFLEILVLFNCIIMPLLWVAFVLRN